MQQQTISHERAIENLMVSYAYANDDADIKGLGEIFKAATFRLDAITLNSREEMEGLASNMIQIREDGRSATTHELTNIVIHIDADGTTASGRAYWTLYQTVSGSPRQAVLSGRYEDKLAYTDGQWVFAERNATILWKLSLD